MYISVIDRFVVCTVLDDGWCILVERYKKMMLSAVQHIVVHISEDVWLIKFAVCNIGVEFDVSFT